MEDIKIKIKKALPHFILAFLTLTLSFLIAMFLYTFIADKIYDNKNQIDLSEDFSGELLKPSKYDFQIPYAKAIKSNKPLIVIFYTDYDYPSKKIFYNLSKIDLNGINIVGVDFLDSQTLYINKSFGVYRLPAMYKVDTKTGDIKEIGLSDKAYEIEGLNEIIKENYDSVK